jgi:DNA-binding response OmpR family regulator
MAEFIREEPVMMVQTSEIVSARAPLVLLVDGDVDTREMYGLALSRAGFRVDRAGDGLQALARLARRTPAVIVLEPSVSGIITGHDLCRRVRADAATRTVPLVAVTARAFPADAVKAKAAGCQVVLTKPCLPETLVNEVRRLLSGREDTAQESECASWLSPSSAASWWRSGSPPSGSSPSTHPSPL